MKRQAIVLAAVCFLGVSLGMMQGTEAQNKQPISVSMAECSVIFSMVAENSGKEEKKVKGLRKGADLFQKHAVIEAKAENQPDPEAYVKSNTAKLVKKWDERLMSEEIKMLFYMSESMEWIQYCGKLGKDRGFLPVKP